MIPKVIHYCWFGRGTMPARAKKCIRSWKKNCPDYEMIEWNEDNFDINCCEYVKQAYESKKYAFVTDYVRLYVLYMYGGVYMDVDVEVVKNLDAFLENKAFTGFETSDMMVTGILAAEKGNSMIGELLLYYKNQSFLVGGKQDLTTNTKIITDYFSKIGFQKGGQMQVIDGFALYPQDYFCPLDNVTGVIHKTQSTATIHWFNKSWVPWYVRLRSKITRIFHRMFGVDCFRWARRLINKS